ncbi:hypothetical protein [Pseudomonas sp. NBRC 111121]|uniref:hypothetical protein n=1 Tax=Pseudomonas sp. NBRC 111121 TaxID=1661036 RepID=UPI0012E23A0C|nr:hypothetical protein [Pseudomonas sp. NBRC 111121]
MSDKYYFERVKAMSEAGYSNQYIKAYSPFLEIMMVMFDSLEPSLEHCIKVATNEGWCYQYDEQKEVLSFQVTETRTLYVLADFSGPHVSFSFPNAVEWTYQAIISASADNDWVGMVSFDHHLNKLMSYLSNN